MTNKSTNLILLIGIVLISLIFSLKKPNPIKSKSSKPNSTTERATASFGIPKGHKQTNHLITEKDFEERTGVDLQKLRDGTTWKDLVNNNPSISYH